MQFGVTIKMDIIVHNINHWTRIVRNEGLFRPWVEGRCVWSLWDWGHWELWVCLMWWHQRSQLSRTELLIQLYWTSENSTWNIYAKHYMAILNDVINIKFAITKLTFVQTIREKLPCVLVFSAIYRMLLVYMRQNKWIKTTRHSIYCMYWVIVKHFVST